MDRHLTTRRFVLALLAITVVGIGVRVVYVNQVVGTRELGADSTWYYLQAGNIRDGAGFVDPAARFQSGAEIATAAHPPAYPAFLAVELALGARSEHRFEQLGALTGAATIVLTALVALAVAGPAVALVAAALVALDPLLIASDGSLMSETLYVVWVVLAMLLAVRAVRSRAWEWWFALGCVLGLAVLTRQDATLLTVLLVVPLAWMLREPPRARVLKAVAALAGVALIVGPWVVRNAIRVDDASVTTSSAATALAGANCDATYYGNDIGRWDFSCLHQDRRTFQSETAWSKQLRRDALHYARTHLGRTPVVATVRLARGLGLYAPGAQATYEAGETRSRSWQLFSYLTSFALLVVGAWGIVRRAPDRFVRWILAAPVVTGLAVIVLSSPITRFRALGEPSLAIGAALIAVSAVQARRSGQRASLRE